MTNEILTKEIQTVIDNQIKIKQPKCTNETYLRLQNEGCRKQEAKLLISKVLEKYIRNMIMSQTTFNETAYANDLAKLSKTKKLLQPISFIKAMTIFMMITLSNVLKNGFRHGR